MRIYRTYKKGETKMVNRRKKKTKSPDRKHAAAAAAEVRKPKQRVRGQQRSGKPKMRKPALGTRFAPSLPPAGDGFFMVGVGASAGGLEAFRMFFQAVPPDTGMAFILVPHLEPTHVSMLPELLGKETQMEIRQVEDGMPVEPNRIYIIPPNSDMEILKGALHLTGRKYRTRGPIDNFFSSLAADQRNRAVGIILSGMGSDGTAGLRAIREAGGRTIIQDPDTAKFNGMPQSAVTAGVGDFVVPPEQMAQVLQTLRVHRPIGTRWTKEDETLNQALAKIFILLRNATGHDFSAYKRSTLIRRIERRMSAYQIENISDYVRFLMQNQSEVKALFKEILIYVTRFFRDPEAFDALKVNVLPSLFEDRTPSILLRVWVVGCSTGEEAYSLAMVLQEYIDEYRPEANFQMFATDLDEDSIHIARGGVYSKSIAEDVPGSYIKRFFSSEHDSFRVRREIREKIVFAVQDVIKDPPFTKVDLISCRNLLIYMDSELQARVIPVFQYSLNPGGMLFLGTSETVPGNSEYFSVIDRKWKIFRRRERAGHKGPEIDFTLPLATGPEVSMLAPKKNQQRHLNIEKSLLAAFAPPCVVIDSKGEIQYLHGRTGLYLEPPSGEAKMNIYDMAREGLKEKLPMGIHRAASQNRQVVLKDLSVKSNGGAEAIHLTIQPLPDSDLQGLLMLVFQRAAAQLAPAKEKVGRVTKKERSRVEALQKELEYTKENLQSAIEELQTTTEEQKSIAEEYMSTNEELQSANEELESSREEMQSLNEELTTVNVELQHKIEDLARTNEEVNTFMDSLGIPSIFLDEDLRIKRFTSQISRIVNLIRTDIGRPLKDIQANLVGGDLIQAVELVLKNRHTYESEVETRDGHAYLMRILPYQDDQKRGGGVVVTFIDIHDKKSSKNQLRAMQSALDYSSIILETMREPILLLDGNMRVVYASSSFYEAFQTPPEETTGRAFFEVADGQWNISSLHRLLEDLKSRSENFRDYKVEGDFPKIGHTRMIINGRRIRLGEGSDRILLAIEKLPAEKE